MTTSASSRIHRAASRLRLAAIAAAALLVLVTTAAVLGPFPDGGLVTPELATGGLPHALAAAIACAVAVPTAIGLVSISLMLSHVSRGDIFSPRAVSHFRRFALCLLLAALLQVLLPAAIAILLALRGHADAVAVPIDVGDLLALFLMVVFYFVSRLFVEASRLDEDSRSII